MQSNLIQDKKPQKKENSYESNLKNKEKINHSNKIAIKIKGLTKSFKLNKILKNMDLEIEQAQIFGLLGSNGAGKSTLIKILIGALKLDVGEIIYFGENKSLTNEIKKTISLVPQEYAFFREFTIEENITFFAKLYSKNNKEIEKILNELIETFELERFRKRKATELSGGYKRLLNFACSLVNDPKIIFLDEPTVGLDPKMRQKIWEKITLLKQQGKCVVITTHYMDEAEILCDVIAILKEGKIIEQGEPQTLIKKHGGKRIINIKIDKRLKKEELDLMKQFIPETEIILSFQTVKITIKNQDNFINIFNKSIFFLKKFKIKVLYTNIKDPELEDVFINLTGETINQSDKQIKIEN